MVSQELQSNNNNQNSSTSLHHFLISDHISTHTRFINPYHQSHFSTMSNHSDMVHDNTTRHFMDLLGGPQNELSLSLGEENCCFMGSSTFPGFVVGDSVFMKPAQSVLKEVVDVGSKNGELSEVRRLFFNGRGVCNELRSELLTNVYLSSHKHELQILLSKLLSLLEQVEGRYDEYCQRMEELISSFEVIAGEGAATCYTALALQAMSRHFSNLRHAIVTQIKLARKKLSNDLPKLGNGLSHLSLFGQESQSNNSRSSLQEIGITQGVHRHAWRPIRGLPEMSVTILRAWLFEHFLHPYPNDSEKLTLASQTGLSKNQVANWFINARVRLWKPMIEEMYKDEFGDSSMDSSGDSVTDRAED